MLHVCYRRSTPGTDPSYLFCRPAIIGHLLLFLVLEVTQEHYVNKGHGELMRKGKEGILAAGTLTSGRRFLELQKYERIVYCASDDCYQCR